MFQKLINGLNTWKKKRKLIAETVKFIERIPRWSDCGCVPCTGICMGPESMEIALEGIVDEAIELREKWKKV